MYPPQTYSRLQGILGIYKLLVNGCEQRSNELHQRRGCRREDCRFLLTVNRLRFGRGVFSDLRFRLRRNDKAYRDGLAPTLALRFGKGNTTFAVGCMFCDLARQFGDFVPLSIAASCIEVAEVSQRLLTLADLESCLSIRDLFGVLGVLCMTLGGELYLQPFSQMQAYIISAGWQLERI
jgi:hypothetical protein